MTCVYGWAVKETVSKERHSPGLIEKSTVYRYDWTLDATYAAEEMARGAKVSCSEHGADCPSLIETLELVATRKKPMTWELFIAMLITIFLLWLVLGPYSGGKP